MRLLAALTDRGRPTNRAHVEERIAAALRHDGPEHRATGVIVVDLDRFRTITDAVGPTVGDELLRALWRRCRVVIPEGCSLIRSSADRLVLVAPGLDDADGALALARRLHACVGQPLPSSQGEVFVTASIGVAVCGPDEEGDAETLLRGADAAMGQAKAGGRNAVALFHTAMLEQVAHRLEMETALRRALDGSELGIHYQPIIELPWGTVTGFEALIRWHRWGYDPVPPAELVAVAEDTGLIVPIGRWVILEALTQLSAWIRRGVCPAHTTMSVNISPRQLLDGDLVATVDEALRRTGLPPAAVTLEITETVMIGDPTRAFEVLAALAALGLKIAIDDFGTGYAPLSLLKRSPVHSVKIDRSFVAGLGLDEGDRSLVHAIIAMAHLLGHDVVAEGVETAAQLATLVALGCDRAQGFHFSPPLPPTAVPDCLRKLDSQGRRGDHTWAPRGRSDPGNGRATRRAERTLALDRRW